ALKVKEVIVEEGTDLKEVISNFAEVVENIEAVNGEAPTTEANTNTGGNTGWVPSTPTPTEPVTPTEPTEPTEPEAPTDPTPSETAVTVYSGDIVTTSSTEVKIS